MRIKVSLFLLFALFALQSTRLTAQRKRQDKVVPAFVYHRFGDDRYPSTNISKANFEAHLIYLKKQGYQAVTLSEAFTYLTERSTIEKMVCLTVDDGFNSFYENAFPLLKQYGFKATVFVNTASVSSPDYMGWDKLREIQNAGIEIGNHSNQHEYFLNDSSESRLEFFASDLLEAQNLIEQHLGKRPEVYAYPYGEFDEQLKEVVAQAGIKAAAAQSSGVMHKASDFYELPRFPMSDRYGKMGSFIEKLSMKPIKVSKVETLAKGYNGSPDNPRVIFHFPVEKLRIESIQCFAQGQRCTKSVRVDKEGNVQLTVKSKVSLTSRRTLYTITAPDKEGNWHWYSYTWVITDLK